MVWVGMYWTEHCMVRSDKLRSEFLTLAGMGEIGVVLSPLRKVREGQGQNEGEKKRELVVDSGLGADSWYLEIFQWYHR